MANMMTLALSLLAKLRNADPTIRDQLTAYFKEMKDTGLIPLGMHSDDGGPAYVWLLYDRSRLTLAQRERHVKAKSPPGVRIRTIEI